MEEARNCCKPVDSGRKGKAGRGKEERERERKRGEREGERELVRVSKLTYGVVKAPGLQNISRNVFNVHDDDNEIQTEEPVWRDGLLWQ